MKTQFKTVMVTDTQKVGVPLGEGACYGVRLQLNYYERNSSNQQKAYIYYGDANSQEVELLGGNITKLIPCDDLSEVFVRAYDAEGAGVGIPLQVIIYK